MTKMSSDIQNYIEFGITEIRVPTANVVNRREENQRLVWLVRLKSKVIARWYNMSSVCTDRKLEFPQNEPVFDDS